MGILPTGVEDDLDVLRNDSTISSKQGICFINNLPLELLLHIFQLCSITCGGGRVGPGKDAQDGDDGVGDEDEGGEGDWDEGDEDDDEDDDDWEEGVDDDDNDNNEEEEEDTSSEEEDNFVGRQSGPVPFPIIISHVCHHWRNIALSDPTLWTTIRVFLKGRSFEFASMMLKRSTSFPIDVWVHGPWSSAAASSGSDSDLFSMLVPHIHCWRTMAISVFQFRSMHAFLSALSDPSLPAASQLRTLRLTCDKTKEDDPTFEPSMLQHIILPTGSAPLLTTLLLSGVHVDWSAPWIASAPNLRFLQLGYHAEDVRPSWAQFLTMLRDATSLENFTLSDSGPLGDPMDEPRSLADLDVPVQLSRLRYLSLRNLAPMCVIRLIRKTYLPALQTLVLDLDSENYAAFVRELARPVTFPRTQEQPRSLLSRLTCLTILRLRCWPLTSCVETLYGELQILRSLSVSNMLSSTFLEKLAEPCTLRGRCGAWLPRLEELSTYGVESEQLCPVVRMRHHLGVPLGALYVGHYYIDKEDFKWLRENVKKVERRSLESWIFYDSSEATRD